MAKKIKLLETFENQYPDRDYNIVHTAPEFTSVCPKTGQPDFGIIVVEYVPDKLCVELKSLKLYLQSFRNEGVFYETVTNQILDDLVKVCKPRYMLVTAEFTTRGGISSIIEAEYVSDNYLED